MTDTVTLARPYARAVFDYAKEQKALLDWSVRLANAKLIAESPDVIAILKNPNVTKEHIDHFIKTLDGAGFDEDSRHLLQILQEHQRLLLLPEIAALYERYRQAWEKKITVQVTTAYPLPEDLKEQLIKALEIRLQRTVELECKIDESLLGGAIARADDLVIDGSVKGRLAKLRQVLES